MPKLPSAATGRLKSQTTQLPLKRSGPGKVVVMLSSVAKPPPTGTQTLPAIPSSATPTPPRVTARPAVPPPSPAAPAASPPKVDPISQRFQAPPPLPPKQVAPISPVSPMPHSRLSTTTFVKLPPKTANPSLVTLTGKPATPASAASPTPTPVAKPKEPLASTSPPAAPAKVVPANPATPPPLPAKKTSQALSRKTGAHYIPPIKLHELSDEPASAEDSIFASADTSKPAPKPAGWKELETGELPHPPGGLKNLDVFERSQKILDKPAPLIPPVGITTTTPIVTPARRPLPPPTPATPQFEAKDKATPPPLIAPPLRPPVRPETKTESKATSLNPPPLAPTPIKPPEPPPIPPVQVAPPLLEKAPEPTAAKLPPPITPAETPKSATPPPLAESPAVHKVPALTPPEATPAKPLQAPATSLAKTATDWLKRTAPLVISPSAPATPPAPVAEAKPALKPPVLPKRALLKEADAQAIPQSPEPPLVVETKDAAKKVDAPVSTAKSPATAPALPPKLPAKGPAPADEKKPAASPTAPAPEKSAATAPPPLKTDNPPVAAWAAPLVPLAKAVTAMGEAATAASTPSPKDTSPLSVKLPEKDKSAASTTGQLKAAPGVTAAMTAATATPTAPVAPAAKAPLPKTRVERAKQRRFVATLLFWAVIFPLAILGLVFGSLYFGRETRVEGQVIPPPGMSLNNEMWIVTDFSSLASGIAEDLAQERTPILQEIQERQEHVQRAQADVASREERIRLIQEQISAAKEEINSIAKKSRDATQQIWDGEGAAIENEYQSHFDQLKKAIADRAKSLNLQYEPDETYQSPEVWANAYRLALYQVPPGVDGTKEHQWLSDQMKQWRDLQKALDARKEQLREKAAQLKLEPAPKIADLNAKIEDLQQRVDGTTSEEIPLKAELQQAQVSLADAQAADANLDDKYFKQLYSLPGEATTKRIPLKSNGRFTWIDDNNFMDGEKEHHYLIFSRATRTDGRQYWALHRFNIGKDQTVELIFEPGGFLSTKAILRPNLSPDEQEQ